MIPGLEGFNDNTKQWNPTSFTVYMWSKNALLSILDGDSWKKRGRYNSVFCKSVYTHLISKSTSLIYAHLPSSGVCFAKWHHLAISLSNPMFQGQSSEWTTLSRSSVWGAWGGVKVEIRKRFFLGGKHEHELVGPLNFVAHQKKTSDNKKLPRNLVSPFIRFFEPICIPKIQPKILGIYCNDHLFLVGKNPAFSPTLAPSTCRKYLKHQVSVGVGVSLRFPPRKTGFNTTPLRRFGLSRW